MLYLGLMSGTSADGIDAALVEITAANQVKVRAAQTFALDTSDPSAPQSTAATRISLSGPVIALGQGQRSEDIDELGRLDIAIGEAFAHAALSLMRSAHVAPEQIRAIGSHGQTIRHRPHGVHPFSWQIGCAHVIAERTGVDVVHDFRRRDVAAGGQGAPLVPAFHRAVFPSGSAILNLGGIANVSLLSNKTDAVTGFDLGPANCLLDAHAQRAFNVTYDKNGELASRGKVDTELLNAMLQEPFFRQAPPKSTGREVFNLAWLDRHLNKAGAVPPEDIQATLLALTLESIKLALQPHAFDALYVCGGGVHNGAIMRGLQTRFAQPVHSTQTLGIDPDFVEAAAFAWLAFAHVERIPGNIPAVTGAPPRVLGALVPGR
jgi:anhydro-N-acetylmuramic acid kinase